jgi:hypothetical protein
MRNFVRLVVCAAVAFAPVSPVLAQTELPASSPSPSVTSSPGATIPSDVVVRIEGGYHAANRWLWYSSDGVARFEGIWHDQKGRFTANVDPQRVAEVVEKARLCAPSERSFVQPLALDNLRFRVSVRCSGRWHTYVSYGLLGKPRPGVKQAALDLEKLASDLAWQAAQIGGPPDLPGFRFAPNLRSSTDS